MSTEPLLDSRDLNSSVGTTPENVAPWGGRKQRKPWNSVPATLFWIFGPWLIGSALAALIPSGPSGLPEPIKTISHHFGWVYFSAWSISFYPQSKFLQLSAASTLPLHTSRSTCPCGRHLTVLCPHSSIAVYKNFVRKSVVGLSLDFQVLNLLGFVSYSIYNVALRFNPTVRKEYAALHGGQLPAVHTNDVFFALHAAAATVVTLVQCCMYDRGGARPARASIIATSVMTMLAIGWGAAIVFVPTVDPRHCKTSGNIPCLAKMLTWLSWLYFLSYIKLAITCIKYIPQVILNHRLKSTHGWSIWNVLLDVEGGVLSLAQLIMDASACSDWSPVTGNPVKFALGWTSMLFDAVFVVQHYCLYPNSRRKAALEAMDADLEKAAGGAAGESDDESEEEPLLP